MHSFTSNYHMKKILSCSVLLFYGSLVFSQDMYVTLGNQTIQGTIENYKEWSRNPNTVVFKESVSGAIMNLTPQNCKSFTARSDKYISYNGTRILNSDNIIYSQGVQNDQLIKDTIQVFLRQIYQFKNYTLYKLFDNKRINFFLSDNGDIKELEYYESINNGMATPFNGYKTYLYRLFYNQDINALQHKIDILNYKENDLVYFFADIFNDKSHALQKLRNNYPPEILVGAGANVNLSTLEDIYGRYTFHQTNFSPSFEFGLRIYSQRNFGRLFFQPSISVIPLSNSFEGDNFKIKATLVNINLGAGYKFMKKSEVSFYAEAAGSLPVFFNFQTRKGAGGKYVGTSGPDNRASIHAELGVIIKQSLNISFGGILPVRLPFNSDHVYAYKLSQLSVALRYAFIHQGIKK